MWSYTGLGYQRVKFYDPKRRFGLMQDYHGFGPTIFFHLNDGRKPVIDPLSDEVSFGTARVDREPKVGEYLIFKEGANANGPKATQWLYHDEWAALRDTLLPIRIRKHRSNREEQSFYRQLEDAKHPLQWWVNECVLNAAILRGGGPTVLPPHGGEDEHGPYTLIWERGIPGQCSDNYYSVHGWEICEDPRHPSLR